MGILTRNNIQPPNQNVSDPEMHRLSSSQKRSANEFMTCTQVDEETAIEALSLNQWKLEVAIDNYYQSPETYKRYQSPKPSSSEDKIGPEGLIRFIQDLNLELTSPKVLILAWKFQAETQGEFTKKEFINGMTELKCDSLDTLKTRMRNIEMEIRDDAKFKDFYKFTFQYAKAEPQQKCLNVQTAVAYWNLVLKDKFSSLERWSKFVVENYKKSISKDAWQSVLDFSQTINEDMSNYDENEAWPAIIDDFVEFSKMELNNC